MRADLTYCDFLVLAPLSLEIDALLSALKEEGWELELIPDTADFPCVIEATFTDATVAYFKRHVTIIQLTEQGVLNASVDTARALDLYEPGYVVSFGIAGTFKEEDAPIGAVVFATSLIYYEPAKDKLGVTQSRMLPIKINKELQNLFRRIGDTLDNITARTGFVASGEKLFADNTSPDRERIVQGVTDKTFAVEMEAAGVGQAVSKLCPSAEFIVIKGISDAANDKKNDGTTEDQLNIQKNAASNAARCLAHLMCKAPLRRISRSEPRPSEANWHQTARREAEEIINKLKPYRIKTDYAQLYACLYGRRGRPIPAYYHWRQKSSALHWIDFKILTALKALPREIITPTPLVTIAAKDVSDDQLWHSSVQQLLGAPPQTDVQIKRQLDELYYYLTHIGFTGMTEQDIRTDFEALQQQQDKSPEIVLNIMRYMLGQFCHRRMFVFAWTSSHSTWAYLSRVYGIWCSLFEWDAMELDGKGGKQGGAGKKLLIEPRSYKTLKQWLETCPSPEVVWEFTSHFECHPVPFTQPDAREHLKALMQYWDGLFEGQV